MKALPCLLLLFLLAAAPARGIGLLDDCDPIFAGFPGQPISLALLEGAGFGRDGSLGPLRFRYMELDEINPYLLEQYSHAPMRRTVHPRLPDSLATLPPVEGLIVSPYRVRGQGEIGGTGELYLASLTVRGETILVVAKKTLSKERRRGLKDKEIESSIVDEGRQMALANNLGIGPNYYGYFGQGLEGYHVMELVPGVRGSQNTGVQVTLQTLRSMDRATKALMENAYDVPRDFQWVVDAFGHVVVLDGVGAEKRTQAWETPLDVYGRMDAMDLAPREVVAEYLTGLRATDAPAFRATMAEIEARVQGAEAQVRAYEAPGARDPAFARRQAERYRQRRDALRTRYEGFLESPVTRPR